MTHDTESKTYDEILAEVALELEVRRTEMHLCIQSKDYDAAYEAAVRCRRARVLAHEIEMERVERSR